MAIVFTVLVFPQINAQDLDVPYVSTPQSVVEKMLEVTDTGPGDYVIDLGCGDGRIVISAAQRGAYGHGVDLDPERLREARSNARGSNVSDKVMFLQEDLFKTDFSRANVITMYLLSSVNLKLRPRLLDKLEPGTRVVSHDFDMGEWTPDKHLQVDNANISLGGWQIDNPIAEDTHDIYYWIIPAKVGGQWEWETNGKNFTMTVEQKFQEIYPQISTGNATLNVKKTLLKGERISITAANPFNGNEYVYNGRVEGSRIMGTVQIRGDNNTIETWTAKLMK
ncbi:MAG: class I SAM-dependent methyltransferase [Bacteroidales bacterium]|nr:class I SAM-dependent methyltransferase [Bacteroidales bacterium]